MIEKLIECFIYPWEMNDGLVTIATIQDMSSTDLLEAHQEFEDILNDKGSVTSLYGILKEIGLAKLMGSIADRNLARTTAKDINEAEVVKN